MSGKYLIEEYDFHVHYTHSTLSLVEGSRVGEWKSEDGHGSFLLTQRHVSEYASRGNIFPPPPRPLPHSHTNTVSESSYVKIPLREDVFGNNLTALIEQCLSCDRVSEGVKEGVSEGASGIAMNLPRGLTPHALHLHISTQCNRFSSVMREYHFIYHMCAAYIRLMYTHHYWYSPTVSSVDTGDVHGHDAHGHDTHTSASTSTAFTSWQNTTHSLPLQSLTAYDPELCTDPLWCGKTRAFKRAIHQWQNPHFSDHNNCENAKFLLYVVPNGSQNPQNQQSFTEIIRNIGFLLRFAMCHNRILVLTYERYSDTTSLGSIVSLLGSLTSCSLTADMIMSAQYAKTGLHVGLYPCVRSKVVYMTEIPSSGENSSYMIHSIPHAPTHSFTHSLTHSQVSARATTCTGRVATTYSTDIN